MYSGKNKPIECNGFTMIELIVVIMMIAIMAVTVLPKFFTSNGFEEYTYRDELIIKLRAIQLRTMQQTNNGTCRLIQIDSSVIGLLATTPNATTCESNYAGKSTTVTINANHNVSFTNSEGLSSFNFSSLGRPEALGCGDALTPCEITLTVAGESSLAIKINHEGYIYAS
ncbi:type II secretion system protein [Candidatus Colwellia aromaticivorans]|uniref:type II secretion system protein n=1 Tax=Candidatus Colwellia aromaticivorans TaxID=2267621 RepID=UPI000DF2C3C1|nr:type II secretion system protein [Candidatus Colwellia aromaticivorans]